MQRYEMGKPKRTSIGLVMTAVEVAKHLTSRCESLAEFESFMFGSSLFGIGSDFDILIIGPDGDPLARLKAEIAIAGQELPLDVLYMLPQEANETNFVMNEGCVPLAQLAALDATTSFCKTSPPC